MSDEVVERFEDIAVWQKAREVLSLLSTHCFLLIACCLVFTHCSSLIAPLFAADCQWRETTGEAAVENITAEEARRLALNAARLKAVEDVSGVRIQGSTLVKDLELAAEFVQVMSAGYVLEERVLGWESTSLQERPESPPVTVYKVRLKSCVAPTSPGDPYFSVKGELNRPVFMAGEEAWIRARCTKDCYLAILNLTADEKIRVLLPNRHEPSVKIKGGEAYDFPRKGLALEMRTLPDHGRDVEAFLLIATKERCDLLSLAKKDDEISPKEFYRAILSLPTDTRAQEMLLYEVRER